MTQSARYTIRRLWDAVPVLTTNLLETGLVDQNFNDSLTRSALKAFDIYISTHHHDRKVSHGLPFFQDNSPPPSELRRKRRTGNRLLRHGRSSRSLDPADTMGGSLAAAAAAAADPDRNAPTSNDNFFEHQRTRGYRMATEPIANCQCARRLQEDLLVDAAASYLREGAEAQVLADRMLLGDGVTSSGGELSVDMWVSVQRGVGAHHGYHVHDGALVSGVYYAAVPPGSAPLCLRRPEEITGSANGDVVIDPTEGQLILFPPWIKHGVPPSQDASHTKSNLPRVSFALNVTDKFGYGDPWDVTRRFLP